MSAGSFLDLDAPKSEAALPTNGHRQCDAACPKGAPLADIAARGTCDAAHGYRD